MYKYRKNHVGYLIVDKETKSMIAIDPGDLEIS